MKLNFKNRLGMLERGISGIIQNNFEKNPDISQEIQKYPIGKSAGGLVINLFEIGVGPRKILFVGGTHGNEVGTIKLACHITNWLNANKENFPNLSFYIIPCLNPDGLALARKHPNYFGGGKLGDLTGMKWISTAIFQYRVLNQSPFGTGVKTMRRARKCIADQAEDRNPKPKRSLN